MPEQPPDPLLDRVSKYVDAIGSDDAADVANALAESRMLVTNHCASQEIKVPYEILNRAIVEVAAELFHRKSARNGVMDIAGADLAPFRVRNDPLKAVYPLLTPFIGLGLA